MNQQSSVSVFICQMPPLVTSVLPPALLSNGTVVHLHNKIFEYNLKRPYHQTCVPLHFPSNNLDKSLNCFNIRFLTGINSVKILGLSHHL